MMVSEMHLSWLVIFGIFGALQGANAQTKYENHTLIRLFPRNDLQLERVRQFQDPDNLVEVLKPSGSLNDSLDLLVPPEKLKAIHDFAWASELALEVKDKFYGRKFTEFERSPRRRVLEGNPAFRYMSYAQMSSLIERIAYEHSDLVTLQDVGNSYEGRKMVLVKISSNRAANNPVIFVDAGIHAREWVAPSMALYLMIELATNPSAKADLDGIDWYILPMVNPDGYEYSRASPKNRMWRKTMSASTAECFGVDGNRNYGFKWAESGVTHNPCDKETYAGPRPFSEPETRIVKKIMLENQKRIKLYVSLHAYGQYLVYPWGYTRNRLPKEWKKLDQMARQVSGAVVRAGGLPFKVLSAGKWYPAAGGSDDFAFGAMGIPYSYTMELTDGHEFIYPEILLSTVLPQFYQGFRTFGNEIKAKYKARPRSTQDDY